MTEIKREDLVKVIGFDPLVDRQRRDDHAAGIRHALAQAWLWVRDATTSEDESGEMVVECLKKLREPLVTLEDVEQEAKRKAR